MEYITTYSTNGRTNLRTSIISICYSNDDYMLPPSTCLVTVSPNIVNVSSVVKTRKHLHRGTSY